MNPPRKSQSSRANPDKDAAPFSLDYDHLWRLCIKYWKWLAAAVVAGAVLGFCVTLFQTPIYAARSTIEVPARETSLSGADSVGSDYTGSEIATYVQLLQTKALPEQVGEKPEAERRSEFSA